MTPEAEALAVRLDSDGVRLLQQRYRCPWKQGVVTILLNQTTGAQVVRVLPPLFRAFPTPRRMEAARGLGLECLIQPLGLQNRRAELLRRFSGAWADFRVRERRLPTPEEYLAMPGVGKYACDSYRLFALGDATIEPEDKKLQAFMRSHGLSGVHGP